MDNKKASPKDVFLQLLAIIAFYVCVISFLVLVFQYINLAFPDRLETGMYYDNSGTLSQIRWSVATLVIFFPLYIWFSWFLNKEYVRSPEKRSLRIRKWLTYFTLSLAVVTVAGDLVTLIYNFLEGDLTARFALKVLAVLFVAVSTFAYYFWDIRKHNPGE